MDAKPDELVIALGSNHVARILDHLHEHALQTDVDFENVVPGISGETCMKVWQKLKAEASASSVTIKSETQSAESDRSENEPQNPHSRPISSKGDCADDLSPSTLPRPRSLIHGIEDNVDEDEGEGGKEIDIETPRTPSPVLQSEDQEASLKIASKAPVVTAKDATAPSPVIEEEHHKDSSSQSLTLSTKTQSQDSAWVDGRNDKPLRFLNARLQTAASTPKTTSKRPSDLMSASLTAPAAKRPYVSMARRVPSSQTRNRSGCKHNICVNQDKCFAT